MGRKIGRQDHPDGMALFVPEEVKWGDFYLISFFSDPKAKIDFELVLSNCANKVGRHNWHLKASGI